MSVYELLRVTVGSGAHGIAIEGTDDHDEMGIYIEPPVHVLGLDAPLDSRVWRSQPEGVRSGPGDVDRVQYSLRKYLRLATQGNPTVLIPLFVPHEMVLITSNLGDQLRGLAPSIVSKRAGPRFLGYMQAQIERLEGTRRSKPNRPELVEKHGYDTKFASHAARLAMQGIELMATGIFTLPMRDYERDLCLSIKRGEWRNEEVIAYVRNLRRLLAEAVEKSPLREKPDTATLNHWMVNAYLNEWSRWNGTQEWSDD